MHKYTAVSIDDELSSKPDTNNAPRSGSGSSRWFASLGGTTLLFVALSLLSFIIMAVMDSQSMDQLVDKNSSFPTSPAIQPSDLPSQAKYISNSSSILMVSFPNSGTTYTMFNVQEMSNLSLATSYGNEIRYEGDILFVGEPYKSPFIVSNTLERPRFFLTKSHCGGHTVGSDLLIPPKAFERRCMSLVSHEKGRTTRAQYHDLPAKAVHLVRDPHDNLVARMHFANYHNGGLYSRDEAGFREWCSYVDSLPPKMGSMKDQLGISNELIQNLPCISEWFRYVQWHNNAVAMLNSHDYPMLTIYYDDYSVRYQETVDTLFDFLEQDQVKPPLPFIANKTYHSYYDAESKELAAKFVRQLATPECWALIQRYFT